MGPSTLRCPPNLGNRPIGSHHGFTGCTWHTSPCFFLDSYTVDPHDSRRPCEIKKKRQVICHEMVIMLMVQKKTTCPTWDMYIWQVHVFQNRCIYFVYTYLFHIKSDWPTPPPKKKWWDSPSFSWLGQMSEPSRQLVVPWLSVCISIFPSRENWSSSWAEVWWFCWWKNTLKANLGISLY